MATLLISVRPSVLMCHVLANSPVIQKMTSSSPRMKPFLNASEVDDYLRMRGFSDWTRLPESSRSRIMMARRSPYRLRSASTHTSAIVYLPPRQGVIPDGSVFVLNPANGSQTFSWIPNVAGGTQLFFYMVDSLGQQGGTTGVMTVEQSGDSSCLDSSSPASTGNPSSLVTATSTSTSTQTGTISASSSTSHRRVGTLIAAIVVPVVAVITLVIGVFICYRRRRRNGGVRVLGPRKSRKPVVDLMKGDPDTPPQMEEVGSPTTATPFLHGRSLSANGETTLGGASSPPDTSATTPQSNAQSGGSSSLAPVSASGIQPAAHAGARRKAAEASVLAPPGHQPSTRFILHTDIEDDVPPPVEEVVELPPQYSERRRAGPVASRSNSHPQVGEPSVPQL